MLELMHFASELREVEDFRQPREAKIAKKELDMAKALIDSMSEKWEPEAYKDDYREALEEMIEEKVKHPDKELPKKVAKKRPSNVIDLVSVLQESMRGGSKKKKTRATTAKKKATARKRTKTRAAA